MKKDWDFKNANTKEFTHGFHTYPAMMIPQIARKLIKLYGNESKILLDPFCGSGTSLVEASITNNIKEAYGIDLNPLAILMTRVKTTPLNVNKLEKSLRKIILYDGKIKKPDFKNINFWFKSNVIKELSKIKAGIDSIKGNQIKDFFMVVFSETVRKVSNTRNREFKLYRMDKKKLEEHSPNVKAEFEKIAKKNIEQLKKYNLTRKKTKTKAITMDIKDTLPLSKESVDIIVTSPPYGDSKTTVAYGQFSRLALQWMGFEDANQLDNKLLGGRKSKDHEIRIESPTLKKTVKQIRDLDEKRALEVLSFYEDFDKSVEELNRVIKRGGHVCFVVGNRTVKGINIPTDKIMVEMFQAKGNYNHLATYLRAIPKKRMPKANSPTNEKGKTVTTMNNEFIFILKKK